MDYYIYMLRCEDGSLYTGITTDPARRLAEHLKRDKKGAKYTHSHIGTHYEAVWKTCGRSNASKLEYRIKRLTKADKEALVRRPEALADFFFDQIDATLFSCCK